MDRMFRKWHLGTTTCVLFWETVSPFLALGTTPTANSALVIPQAEALPPVLHLTNLLPGWCQGRTTRVLSSPTIRCHAVEETQKANWELVMSRVVNLLLLLQRSMVWRHTHPLECSMAQNTTVV